MQQSAEVLEVIGRVAETFACPFCIADSSKAGHVRYGIEKQRFDYGQWKKLEITLAGKFQIDNAVLALEAVKALGEMGFSVSEAAIRKGLKEAVWPGRFQLIGKKPYFIVDGAHNEDAAQKLAESIEFYFTNKRIIYIMGILKDKEYEKIISLTAPFAAHIITVKTPDNPRAMDAYELACEVAKQHESVTAAGSLEEAVEMSYLLADKDSVILAFGSLSYLGKLMDIMDKRQRKV